MAGSGAFGIDIGYKETFRSFLVVEDAAPNISKEAYWNPAEEFS